MLENIIVSAIAGAGAGTLLTFFIKTYFAEKVRQSIKNTYDEKIENLKGTIGLNQSMITNAINTLGQNNTLAQEKRIEAIKEYWNGFTTAKNCISGITNYDKILLESEFSSIFTPEWNGNQILPNYFNELEKQNVAKSLTEIENHLEEYRPFLNENLWTDFLYLKTFNGRIFYLYSIGSTERKIK